MGEFNWPWEYNFPPFFTLQPHIKTQEKQISTWCNLICNYQKYKNKAILDIKEDREPFINSNIRRKLPLKIRVQVLEELCKTGHASPIDKTRTLWDIYWHTLDEWSNLIYDWAVRTGQTNSVCTIFEILNGEDSSSEEFYQLDQEVILKALKVLESKEKCEIIMFDDNQGVKFF